ncbi:MAG: alpha/beta fold hydrolase [Pyrinomonadaceae bacterium]|nr:alpha/beta fold hydrolase [Pyrinomonadaceae bacterium]MCX7639226.1 alpha/beta fold hydrolase [Pyrinomonadaceae bacterium]MDW8303552.1 alpha/beta fold hydrolase [Acidobacteriota bacterium]
MKGEEILTNFDREIREVALPICLESLVGVDWFLLHVSPVYYGLGIPKGNGSAVILVPGFLGSDAYLYELHCWLARIGYKPYFSGIGWNADCLNVLVEKLQVTVGKAYEETRAKVHLIGHSLGGIISRSLAAQNPELIESVITLASPFRGVRSHPKIIKLAEKVRQRIFARKEKSNYPRCYTGYCNCPTIQALKSFPSNKVRRISIYTKSDGIVDWRACLTRDPKRNFEVTGTHIGLVYNFQVYKLIANFLAESLSNE